MAMPRRRVRLDEDHHIVSPSDPEYDNYSDVYLESKRNPPTREQWRQYEAENPEVNTLEDLQTEWEKIRSYYQQSRCRAAVRDILQQRRPLDGWQINSAVIFGTGDFFIRWRSYLNATLLQVAAFLDVVEYLSAEDSEIQHHLYAQDPLYKSLDNEFLLRLGITPMKDPLGQRLMNRHVFGFVAGCTLDAEIMDQCRHLQPKLWVGNDTNRLVDGQSRVQKSPETGDWPERWGQAEEGDVMPPRQEARIAAVRSFGERHEFVEFPRMDDPTIYDHNIHLMWFETNQTRSEMASESEVTKQECGGCRDGNRSEWRSEVMRSWTGYDEERKTEGERKVERTVAEMMKRRKL